MRDLSIAITNTKYVIPDRYIRIIYYSTEIFDNSPRDKIKTDFGSYYNQLYFELQTISRATLNQSEKKYIYN